MSGKLSALWGAALVGLVLAGGAQAAPAYKAKISRTAYGIPHVEAADYRGIGYGQAYAFTQDNLCLLADKVVTVNGERSKYFGPDGATTIAFAETKNLESDFFFRANLDVAALNTNFDKLSADYRNMVLGYVAGYNRFLRDTPKASLPAACRDAVWLRPITLDDMLRLNEERMIQASGGAWLRQVNAAAPPALKAQAALDAPGLPTEPEQFGLGSNGWAFGRDVTANKSGVLLGNPHFPWETTNRFYQVHLTIPGKLDVMGVTIGGAPGMSIGFNKDVAWTHTVSTDRHFTVFELSLDPADPTAYYVDGERLTMATKAVTVEVKDGPAQTRMAYSSIYGPMVVMPQVGGAWTAKTAYALRDANKNNVRSGDTWLGIARARSVGEIRAGITKTLGIPWVNTIASDRRGDVLYADITATPNVTAELSKTCAPPSGLGALAASARIFVLDGARSACNWQVAAGTPSPGLMPGDAMPAQVRTDYVANSNDSYWLANGRAPMAAFPPIVGPAANVQNLRTRSGLMEIEARLAGTDGLPGKSIDPAAVWEMLYRNRNLAADLAIPDLLKMCAEAPSGTSTAGKDVSLVDACTVLAQWDRRMNVDSRGAHLFVEFWRKADRIAGLWSTPFDAADPVHTPNGLNTTASSKLKTALADAVELLATKNVALDAPWGEVQYAVRGDQKIPVHGGEGTAGVLNAQQSAWVGSGLVPFHGSSYIQVVTFGAKGPVAEAILTYDQSTDPASPHYADQSKLHSTKGRVRLPFSAAEIAADKALKVTTIEE
ncbi:MAG: acylase [Phenylobacterium sp.]|uniref:acylase n=1 Tax=Phenylobacterium sp. TaxID=1871053 RepID=UPI002731BA09|nr:acylase [Phenylobacterium sp.]MDP2012542.1 acylase [Phenylobacterium sp.]